MAKLPLKMPDAVTGKLPASLGGEESGVVPVVRIEGVIASGGTGLGRSTVNVDTVEHPLHRAFTTKGAKAVALSINSPGGSPTQCEYLAARIRQLADEHEVPVLAFCEDVAASGGYWLACAADEIYATATSMVGSIGVVSAGFGFTDLLGNLGVERRLYTAGDAKARLDPFVPENPDDIAWLTDVQSGIHAEFRDWVIARRPAISAADTDLFTGDLWLGREAHRRGLIDGIGTLRAVVEEKYPGAKVAVTGPRRSLFARLGLPSAGVDGVVESIVGAAHTRMAWARYGR
ncbi:S49 family peptidase [Rhodococcus triatomae]|uniref:Serine protease SohB n=1 Tax=Rhodococcus triatomae TaxID=300028 RepID=A0A1G8HUV1_9NOCA|nr:S49 family peptidase [Rhodococcus triatomae]QNG20881.1 S49 family peptidase [Rhodococcus triatomae]QNG23204.1 S49 family peptidase [Rhodococcus triatomae]SDI10250.1 serine protease SohB [Rhodococcus triatomae]